MSFCAVCIEESTLDETPAELLPHLTGAEGVDFEEMNEETMWLVNMDFLPTCSWQNAYAELLRRYADVWSLWLEEYEELLRRYGDGNFPMAHLHVFNITLEHNAEWNFHLHDINKDGIPELLISITNGSGHLYYPGIYTFGNNGVIQMDVVGGTFFGDGWAWAMADDSPWIVFFHAAGSGGIYSQMKMDGTRLVESAQGFSILLNQERFDRGWELFTSGVPCERCESFRCYCYHELIINGEPATVEEFNNVFGATSGGRGMRRFEITETNITNHVSDVSWTYAIYTR